MTANEIGRNLHKVETFELDIYSNLLLSYSEKINQTYFYYVNLKPEDSGKTARVAYIVKKLQRELDKISVRLSLIHKEIDLRMKKNIDYKMSYEVNEFITEALNAKK